MNKLFRLTLLSVIAVAIIATGCNDNKAQKQKDYPMFWTWLDYRPKMNFDSICQVIHNTGFDGLILNAPTPDDYRKAIPIAHKYGIEVYAWLWTMNLEHDRETILREHPEWFSVNRNGESLADTKAYVDYYKFMCPALPEVREYIKDKIRAYCEVEGLNGIAIDYHRFVDVVLPTTLWPQYGVVQDREYPEWDYGYHPAMIEKFMQTHDYDPRELEAPSADEQWLQFRCDQITEVANEIAEVVHSYGKTMAASPFPTPAMSRKMVRQDWGKWNLDIVFPMVYHNFYTGDVSFISDCTIDNVFQKNPQTTLYCGMMATDGPKMIECMDAALNNGAEGIAVFTVSSLRSEETRAQFKAYADSMRQKRKSGEWTTVNTAHIKPNTNPFENEGIMKAVDFRMKAYISLHNALNSSELKGTGKEEITKIAESVMQVNSANEYTERLTRPSFRTREVNPTAVAIANQFKEDIDNITLDVGQYQLADEYGATKCYKVAEANSNITFDVTFYFYGDVISGWSVMPEK